MHCWTEFCTKRVRMLIALISFGTLLASASGCARHTTEDETKVAQIQVDSKPTANMRLRAGITHTQFSADTYNQPASVAAGRELISGRPLFQNQHIMGWGALNPQPAPGIYDWASLDARMELIRQTSGTPVITLCCAPDWMKGGVAGQTDWSNLDVAPSPDHYGEFAAMAGEIARRYPDVKYFQVWHGLKGFFDKQRGRWNYEGYTDLYNLVYRQLKSVNPEIQVGGPYVIMDSWSESSKMTKPSKVRGSWGVVDQRALDVISYWLKKKEGADFITLDMSLPNKDGIWPVDAFQASEKMSALAQWVMRRTNLPLWAARWNPFPPSAKEWSQARQSAVLSSAFLQMALANVEVELLWEPQGKGSSCTGCLWTDTRLSGGGQPTLAYAAVDGLAENFPPDMPLMNAETSSQSVTAVSSPTMTAVINQAERPQEIEVDGLRYRLTPYEVRMLPRG